MEDSVRAQTPNALVGGVPAAASPKAGKLSS